jgi:hypothetical protein
MSAAAMWAVAAKPGVAGVPATGVPEGRCGCGSCRRIRGRAACWSPAEADSAASAASAEEEAVVASVAEEAVVAVAEEGAVSVEVAEEASVAEEAEASAVAEAAEAKEPPGVAKPEASAADRRLPPTPRSWRLRPPQLESQRLGPGVALHARKPPRVEARRLPTREPRFDRESAQTRRGGVLGGPR